MGLGAALSSHCSRKLRLVEAKPPHFCAPFVHHEWDFTGFIRSFLNDPDPGLPRGHLHCALFLLQRAYLKEAVLRWDSPEAGVIRELFLALCRDDVPEEYRNEEWWVEWEQRHRPKLGRYLEFVRHRHEQTKYRERGTESDL